MRSSYLIRILKQTELKLKHNLNNIICQTGRQVLNNFYKNVYIIQNLWIDILYLWIIINN